MNIKEQFTDDSLHWSVLTVIYASFVYLVIFFVGSIGANETFKGALTDMLMNGWGIVSVCGMWKLKRWGLISYIVFRVASLLLTTIIWATVGGSDPVKDAFYFICILLIFLIKKNGHSAYEVMWKNGNINK